MAVSLKVLAVTGTLVSGGIAIPLYLKNAGTSPAVSVQTQGLERSPAVVASRTTRSSESVEQVSCKVSTPPSEPSQMVDFVREKGNQLDLYSLVSCTNPSVQDREDSYLGKKWDGLFPTKVLEEKLSYSGGEEVEIKATVDKEEDHHGNGIPMITFSNPSNPNSIKSKWDIEETGFQKKALVIQVKGVNQGPNKIYLFVDPKE